MLSLWSKHFQQLTNSVIDQSDPIHTHIRSLWSQSFAEESEDVILDIPISSEELEGVFSSLKKRKSPGPDSVCNEHLLYGGPLLKVWLLQMYNAILLLESVPSSMKTSSILPIYKGKGKDPPNPNSYRGISLSSTISKVFETIILRRIMPVLEEANIPNLNQTAYRRGVSIHDATFAVQEAIRRYVREGDIVYQLNL